jgi:hypothetical protein
MSIVFKKGDDVVQNIKPITGKVVGQEIVDDEVQYKVEYVTEDGETHRRLFKENEIVKAE